MSGMRLRYRGTLASIAGVAWRVEIWQRSETAFEVKELTFAGSGALKMEWPRQSKEDVLWGSAATLIVISETDREFVDLYAVEAGSVRLDVYREERLYWSGTMDTEFYEEPYEMAYGYEVGLTFSDLGILGRLNYDMEGTASVRDIVEAAIRKTGSATTGLDSELVSTTVCEAGREASVLGYDGLAVRCDNFVDEEGEPSSWSDVLKGVLQPLGVKMAQRYGRWHLYDLNGLYHSWGGQEIVWDGARQTLGVDKVAKEVVVNFSPYVKTVLLPEIEYEGATDISVLGPAVLPGGDVVYSFWPNVLGREEDSDHRDWDNIEFSLFLSHRGSGLAALEGGSAYGRILPLFGGQSESDCAVYAAPANSTSGLRVHSTVGTASATDAAMRSVRARLPRLDEASAARYLLRLRLELCCDARYNPFNDDESNDPLGQWKRMKEYMCWAYVRCAVLLYGDDGSRWHMSNDEVIDTTDGGNGLHYGTGSMMRHSRWVEGDSEAAHVWLCYYDPDELYEGCPIGGWKSNRQAITPYYSQTLADSFRKIPDGEFMPYPPVGGEIEIRVMSGISVGAKGVHESGLWSNPGLDGYYFQQYLRWMMYKAPELEIVNRTLILDRAELNDVEYRGWVNRAAKDTISIDTVCGTIDGVCPAARGIYTGADGGCAVSMLTRAGRRDHPERLLIGTLCSQYAERCLTLKGEARTDGGLHTYTEQNQGDKIFMLMSDVQDAQSDCTEAEYCELRPDEYSARD